MSQTASVSKATRREELCEFFALNKLECRFELFVSFRPSGGCNVAPPDGCYFSLAFMRKGDRIDGAHVDYDWAWFESFESCLAAFQGVDDIDDITVPDWQEV